MFVFFQAEDGIRDLVRSRGLGDVYKRQVAITSSKPQTTRHTIRGISTTADSQLILIDTPGLHRPRTLLGERLNDLVREALLDVDVVGFCLPADQRVGPGDQFIAAELAELRRGNRKHSLFYHTDPAAERARGVPGGGPRSIKQNTTWRVRWSIQS